MDVLVFASHAGAMDNESSCYCPSCGWPTSEVYELVSRHQTSEGEVVYSRCPCGRLLVWQGAVGTTAMSAQAAASAPPLLVAAGTRFRRLLGTLALSVGVAVTLAVADTLPTAAVLGCVGLGVVIGGMAGVWTWLTTGATWPATFGVAVRAAVLGGIGGIALAGFAVAFGAASVTLLPVAYLVVAVLGWLARTPRGRPC
jgi:hypothetical protein